MEINKMKEASVAFRTAIMVYTLAITKAIIPEKALDEPLSVAESEKITKFLEDVIEEGFPKDIAPMIKQAFLMELQMFRMWVKENLTVDQT